MKTTTKTLGALMAVGVMMGGLAHAQTTIFGSANDGLGGFTHTNIGVLDIDSNPTTFLTENTGSVTYRNQNTGTIDAAFIRQFDNTIIDRTADSGLIYTVSGTFTVSDGYADDNNRLGLILFTDPTTVLSRDNTSLNSPGQIGIVWNTDDNSIANGDGLYTGNNSSDDFTIRNGYNTAFADATNAPSVLRNQNIPFAQDILQGGQVTLSATFQFIGTDINITASMTDAGGVTNTGTATVLAADFTGDYFGFISAYRARNYDGTPDPNGAARDNPLVMDYQSFSVTSIPEPSTLALLGIALGSVFFFRRRK